MSLRNEHILNPITALAFYQRLDGPLLLLAGEGCWLKIFEATNGKLLSQCEIFDGQAIHGIVTTKATSGGEIQVLIWGGSFLTLLKKYDFEQLLAQDVPSFAQAALKTSDWILDAALSPLEPDCCTLITAHNTILRARLDLKSSQVTFETVASPSRSILYSAHLVIELSGEVLVAAGTVFGEIIVWSCSISGSSQVLFTFTGHEGSIFGVSISPLLTLSDKRQSRLLASCSDDRTIRVWDLATKSTISALEDNQVVMRETGFGQNDDGYNQEEKRCVATVMAHASRIWRVKFLAGQAYSNQFPIVNLFSFGEDSTAQQWTLDIDSTAIISEGDHSRISASRLTHMKTFAFHSGKHIWSTAFYFANASRAILATGGADGKISLRNIHISIQDSFSTLERASQLGISHGTSSPSEELDQANSWDLEEDILKYVSFCQLRNQTTLTEGDPQPVNLEPPLTELEESKPPKKGKYKKVIKDTFNRYAFVSENQLLFTTTFGRIMIGSIGAVTRWEEVTLPESALLDLKSYSVVQGIPELGLAYLAGANGKIYVFRGGMKLFEIGSVGSKVADMFKIFNPKTKHFELLVTTLASGVATLFRIGLPATEPAHFGEHVEYELPKKFVVTSAGRVADLLIFGSRSGSLIVFDHQDRAISRESWKGIASSAGDAITTIIPLLRPAGEVGESNYFLTTGRDGVYSIFAAPSSHESSANTIIRCLHIGSLPFGPMIEAAWFDNSDLLLYGFKGKNFVVWNETKQLEIVNVECGGAHRSYAYSPLRESSGGHFAYTKASRLYIHSQQNPSHMIVKRGGHGREIKACSVSSDGEFIATGAEDTTIRIWCYEDKSSLLENQLRCQAIVQKHSAGIQHLHWHGSNYLFSSGGNEEFFVWSIERIPGFGIGVICEATCPDQSEDRDLRIMSLDTTNVSSGSMLISMAFSDSTIRVYRYSKKSGFYLLAKGRYTSSCLTQIRHLEVSDDEAYMVTAATDGNVTLWKVNHALLEEVSEPLLSRLAFLGTHKIHQSTIKSFDVLKRNNSFLVVTGGDDNALGISVYFISQFTKGSESPVPTSYVLRAAHAAAITGLCILVTTEISSISDIIKIVSSSNDQKIKEWHVQLSDEEAKGLHVVGIQNLSDEFTSIADVGGVVVLTGQNGGDDGLQGQKVLIVGNGMEIWKLPGHLR
ncbi:hypothetical protein EG329_008107 [Mollisiaceae sp. DMI_Dod_QoI]|nr:hypothetical protein EG329_008107 [Helotiales sp. DMI_Dod_QoI]